MAESCWARLFPRSLTTWLYVGLSQQILSVPALPLSQAALAMPDSDMLYVPHQ